MCEIMPYYNQLYMSELLKFDPLATEYFSEDVDTERVDVGLTKNDTKRNVTGNEDERLASKQTVDTDVTEKGSVNDTGTTGNTFEQGREGDRTVTQTNTRTETLNETTSKNTSQNDDTTGHTTGTRAEQNNGNNTSVFSDIPQANVNMTITQNANGSTTIAGIDYATTITNQADTRKISGTTEEDSTGSLTRDVDENGSTKNDNTINENNKQVENWSDITKSNEQGTSTLDRAITGNTVTDSTAKNDQQRGLSTTQDEGVKTATRDKKKSREEIMRRLAGRRGVSPAELLEQYRRVLINVDMMIINELAGQFINLY